MNLQDLEGRDLIITKDNQLVVSRYVDLNSPYKDLIVEFIDGAKEFFEEKNLPFEGDLDKLRRFLDFIDDDEFCS